MPVRIALPDDIPALHEVRMSVKENVLRNASLVTTSDYIRYLTDDGKGWLFEDDDRILGFAIVNTRSHNVWALFVHPAAEGRGIGKKLHKVMLDWYFEYFTEPLRLGTAPHTRAESFYTRAGWKNEGLQLNGETKFTITPAAWLE